MPTIWHASRLPSFEKNRPAEVASGWERARYPGFAKNPTAILLVFTEYLKLHSINIWIWYLVRPRSAQRGRLKASVIRETRVKVMQTREHLRCGMWQGDNMSPVHFLILLSRQSVATNPLRITSRAWRDAGGIPPLQGPNGVNFLRRVVTPERIERERGVWEKEEEVCWKIWRRSKVRPGLGVRTCIWWARKSNLSCTSACERG